MGKADLYQKITALLLLGKSRKEIMFELKISPQTLQLRLSKLGLVNPRRVAAGKKSARVLKAKPGEAGYRD